MAPLAQPGQRHPIHAKPVAGETMARLMAVLLDGIAQLEYDRERALPAQQAAYLQRLDQRMETAGISLDGEAIAQPDLAQKARFVAATLAHAIRTDQPSQAAALTSWLALRLPDLRQVKISSGVAGGAAAGGAELRIELDFATDYVRQYPIQFTPRQPRP